MDDLIAFLRARLAVMAADAHRKHDVGLCQVSQATYYANVVCTCGEPARVLSEVDATRRRIELHAGDHDCPELKTGRYPDDWPAAASWGSPGEEWRHVSNEHFEGEPCPTLRLEALPFADRPGYRVEWRP